MRQRTWSDADRQRFTALYHAGASIQALKEAFGRSEGAVRGRLVKWQLHRPLDPSKVQGLPASNLAMIEGRTLFPGRVRSPFAAPQVLAPGSWQRKIGARVEKGPWKGMPLFTLTLEERATCPRSCSNYAVCMGNGMPFAQRNRAGLSLEVTIAKELRLLQERHPNGFVVRAHILGDFYSPEYVGLWRGWLEAFPALRVFGYTAWRPGTRIGDAVERLALEQWARFAVRLSHPEPGPRRAVTLFTLDPPAPNMITCPVELGRTRDCASCGLCWAPAARDKTIAFIAHGPARGRPKKNG